MLIVNMATTPLHNCPVVSLTDLRNSVTELSYRPSYDLLWGQLTSDMVNAFEKVKLDGGPLGEECVSAIYPVYRLIEHIKEEVHVVKRAVNNLLSEVSTKKEHEEQVKRKRYTSKRNKDLQNAAVTSAAISAIASVSMADVSASMTNN